MFASAREEKREQKKKWNANYKNMTAVAGLTTWSFHYLMNEIVQLWEIIK